MLSKYSESERILFDEYNETGIHSRENFEYGRILVQGAGRVALYAHDQASLQKQCDIYTVPSRAV